MGDTHDGDIIAHTALLKAVACKNVKLVEAMINEGVDIFQVSGSDQRNAMMEAIMVESFPIMDLLVASGAVAGHVYGSYGCTAYHYAIMEEKWASLAHLIRIAGYPVQAEGDLTPLTLATNMCYWRGVSILEQERDSPGFWARTENTVFSDVHRRLGRIRKPLNGSDESVKLNNKWVNDRTEYESFAPSGEFLHSIGWYTRDVDDQMRSVYSCSSHFELIEMRKAREQATLDATF